MNMACYRNLTKADLVRVTELCEKIHAADPNDSFTTHLHTILVNAFDNAHFCAERFQMDPFLTLDRINHTGDLNWMPFFTEHIAEHPAFERTTVLRESNVGATHEYEKLKEFHQSPLYNEFSVKVQSQNQLWLAIHDSNELLNCIFSREKAYGEKALAMLHMLHPHIEMAWKQWKQNRSLRTELGILKDAIFQTEEQEAVAAQFRRLIDALPSRQREVIELVAAGSDNQQIADELNISKRTVQKHLEIIFQSLEVQHRTELAAKWHKAHSIQLY
jgi:ATP/maltotriose-dependent transcriptional regulator MalT